MTSKIITFCYRKIIDARSDKNWEQLVFEDSYAEFRMQAQLFDQHKQYRTFGALLQAVPAAEKLHFLVSGAIVSYVQQLQGKIPDLADNLGKLFLSFSHFRFELINSDRADIKKHQVAINFYSGPFTWHDTVDGCLLLSYTAAEPAEDGSIATHLFRLLPYVSIHTLKNVQHD